MSISFELPDEVKDVVDMVHRLAQDEIRPHLRDHEHAGELPPELLQNVHSLGLTTLSLPQEVGGPGLDLRAAAILQEELAWGDVGVAVALSGPGAAGLAVAALGDADQKSRLLAPFAAEAAFERRGALAIVEGPTGFSPEVATTAEKKGDDFVITGEKRYVQDGASSELTVVLARDASRNDPDPWKNLAFFAIEGRPQGLTASERLRTLGLETARYAHVKLEGVRVPAKNRLAGKKPWHDVHEVIAKKRILDAARLVGCCRAASEYANKYATERKAFGKPLYEHQALAFMMADMATKIDACRWLVWRAAWRLDQEGGADQALAEAAVATKHAIDLSVEVTSDAVQVLGGHGYIQDHPVEKWMRDARCLGLVDGLSVDADTQISEQLLVTS
jgi:acyl-CoA dehydrogenase